MSEVDRLGPDELARLAAIEQRLRRESPALDHALSSGRFRGLPDPPRRWGSRSAWPVAALVVVGCLLVARGLTATDARLLLAGCYLVALSFLGRWLPLRRPAPELPPGGTFDPAGEGPCALPAADPSQHPGPEPPLRP